MKLSGPEMILLAAYELHQQNLSPFTIEDLTIQTWRLWPDVFGMFGHVCYPESHKVRYTLMGKTGLVFTGLLDKTDGGGSYSLSANGFSKVQKLRLAQGLKPAPSLPHLSPTRAAKNTPTRAAKNTPKDFVALAEWVVACMEKRAFVLCSQGLIEGINTDLLLQFYDAVGKTGDALMDKLVSFEENLNKAVDYYDDKLGGITTTLPNGRAVDMGEVAKVRDCHVYLSTRFHQQIAILSHR